MAARPTPGISAAALSRALAAFEGAVGKDWVMATEVDRDAYLDIYPLGPKRKHRPQAAVAPATVEEVQAVVRLANQHKVPLWPISRGKNFGYGGAAPMTTDAVMIDLGRMKKILEIDPTYAYCNLEPGVGFFDLYDHIQANKIPLWISVPGNAWGSVIGNALEHGNGGTPYGDHAVRLCGLEVVLPTGELVRTGMGAMANSPTWNLSRHGFGPTLDMMFTQSNFGVVTKGGLHLMPEPPATLTLQIELPNQDDIIWLVDVLARLRIEGVLQLNPTIRNFLRVAAIASQRKEWYDGPGAMPEEVGAAMRKKLGLGWWNVTLTFYGYEEANAVHGRVVEEAFARHTQAKFSRSVWHRGEPLEKSGHQGIPSTKPLQAVNWRGGRGGHIGFSPILPASGKHAYEWFQTAKGLMEAHGFDYYGAFNVQERNITKVTMIYFDQDDAAMVGRLNALFHAMMAEAAKRGYGEYRTHLDFMDDVAATFNFNDHALLRLNERLKDALDPNGIIAPGKQGIWPKRYRA